MLADPDMATPVALLIYAEDDPANASFFPFAEYSPEYQAARWAVRHGAPLRFIDLPASDRLGVAGGGIEDETAASRRRRSDQPRPDRRAGNGGGLRRRRILVVRRDRGKSRVGAGVRRGRRCDDGAARGIEAALAPRGRARGAYADRDREGREGVRGRDRGGVRRLACAGADERRSLAADRELLKGRPKAKIKATWAPWTAPRLARASGYGAGVVAPGWCAHLWATRERRRSRRGVACQGRVRAARSRTFRLDRLGDRGAAAGHRACGASRPPLARLRGIARGRDRLPVRRRARGLERRRGRASDRRGRRIRSPPPRRSRRCSRTCSASRRRRGSSPRRWSAR